MPEQNAESLRIIRALGGNEHTGVCFCPAHRDENTPNLKVSVSDQGKVLVKCFAGCPQEAVVAAIKRLGAWPKNPKQVEYENREQERKRKEQEEQEREAKRRRAVKIVREAAGARTCYREKPDLTLVRRYLNGRGIKAIPPCVLPLTAKQSQRLFNVAFPAMLFPIGSKGTGLQAVHVTHLSQDGSTKLNTEKAKKTYGNVRGNYTVVSEINPAQPLIVAEGIETALSACQIAGRGYSGIAALNADNLPKITLPPYTTEVIIAADNDEVGIKKAREAAARWARRGRSVRIAIPDRVNDWNDALRQARNEDDREAALEVLKHALTQAEVFDGPPDALSMEEVMEMTFAPREYLLKPWLETGSMAMIHAQRGAGKTRFAMAVAYAIATGQSFLHWNVERQARVLYVDGELPGAVLQKRLKLLGPPAENLNILSRDILLSAGVPLPDLAHYEGQEEFLDEIIERGRFDVIILDSLSTLIRSGVENDAESWASVQDWLLKHRFRGRTIILIHHEGRSNKPRGTSKREDTLDTIVQLKELKPPEDKGDDEVTFELGFTKTREFYGAAKLILHVTTNETGVAEWRYELARDHTRDRVLELDKSGWSQKDIAKELNLTQPRVSQILKEAKTGRGDDKGRNEEQVEVSQSKTPIELKPYK